MHRLSMLSTSMIVTLAGLGAASPVWATLPPAPAGVQVTTEYGIEFSTVGDPGNAAWVPPRFPPPNINEQNWVDGPIGAVDHSFRIGRTEITTGQWLQFVNTFSTRPTTEPLFRFFQNGPYPWGATEDPNYTGPGVRYALRTDVPKADMLLVAGLTWRSAAIYCNWLHNGQSSDWSALQNGAYDISTFGGHFFAFTDQLQHNPDARFWIPSLNEWVKAAHFDPNKGGEGQPGYWNYANGSDIPPIYGPPGIGQANAGFRNGDFSELNIPLASYGAVQSTYGLLDAMGGTSEWTEGFSPVTAPQIPGTFRYIMGSSSGDNSGFIDWDAMGAISLGMPSLSGGGFRIAAAIPGPSTFVPVILVGLIVGSRNRRVG